MPTPAPTSARLARGVWALPYGSATGAPLLAAVDHQGRRVAECVVSAGEDPDTVSAALWTLLDTVAPIAVRLPPSRPALAIVPGAAGAAASLPTTRTGRRRAPRLTLAHGGAPR